MKINFFKQDLINLPYQENFFHNASQLFDSSTSLVGGKFTKDFEDQFSKYLSSNFFSYVSNGLDALSLALESIGIKPGDEVIVPCHTYIATWLAPLRLGCVLKVAPVREDNLLLDVNQLETYMSEDVKAVMPVHLYGNTCDIDALKFLCKKYNCMIVEDAAQAHGSSLNNKMVGSLGDLTCFSFYPTKNLGAIGEAGGIATNDRFLYEKINSLRNYGRSPQNGSINQFCGLNRRGDELQACFLVEKLKSLDSIVQKRSSLIATYKANLAKLSTHIRLLDYQDQSSPHLAIIRLNSLKSRNLLKSYLGENGVQTAIHYSVPCHMQPFYDELIQKPYVDEVVQKQAQDIANTILSLPLSEVHSHEEAKYVCIKIEEFFTLNSDL